MTITSPATGAAAPVDPQPAASPRRRKSSGGGKLWRYLVVRFVLTFPPIFTMVSAWFFLMRLTGTQITAAPGGRPPPYNLHRRIHEAGYDRPLWIQYVEFLGQI